MKCKYCKKEFEPKFFNQKDCEEEHCRNQFIKDTLNKTRNNIQKERKKETKELKEKIKTLSEWKNELQSKINLIARLIDFNQPCIATGNYKGKMNGGHYYSVGSNPTIRFNLHNIHIQSYHSNSAKGGDNIRYIDGIEKIYGIKYKNKVIKLKQISEKHYTKEDIKQMIIKAKEVIKELKEINKTYTPEERIELRTKYNEIINI